MVTSSAIDKRAWQWEDAERRGQVRVIPLPGDLWRRLPEAEHQTVTNLLRTLTFTADEHSPTYRAAHRELDILFGGNGTELGFRLQSPH